MWWSVEKSGAIIARRLVARRVLAALPEPAQSAVPELRVDLQIREGQRQQSRPHPMRLSRQLQWPSILLALISPFPFVREASCYRAEPEQCEHGSLRL